MPWEQTGSGYTTKRGGHIANPGQYEKLRAKGMSKERAARITNAVSKSDKIVIGRNVTSEQKRQAGKAIGTAALLGGGAVAGHKTGKLVGTWRKLGHTQAKYIQPAARWLDTEADLKTGGKAALVAGGGGYLTHRNRKKDPVRKELRMKDPIEIAKADALWRRDDDDIEKGIFGGLSQGLRKAPTIGPMQRSTQIGFNAGSKVRSAGSRVIGAVRTGAKNFGRGAGTPVGPMPANASTATKVGQAAGRAPGRLVSAVQSRPKTAIGIGAGATGVGVGGGYAAGRNKQKRPY